MICFRLLNWNCLASSVDKISELNSKYLQTIAIAFTINEEVETVQDFLEKYVRINPKWKPLSSSTDYCGGGVRAFERAFGCMQHKDRGGNKIGSVDPHGPPCRQIQNSLHSAPVIVFIPDFYLNPS